MSQITDELDEKLSSLDQGRARQLEAAVREAISKAENGRSREPDSDWPPGYFGRTTGVLAGETFDRPSQGVLPSRRPVDLIANQRIGHNM